MLLGPTTPSKRWLSGYQAAATSGTTTATCASTPARGDDARVMSFACHGKRQFPVSIGIRSFPRGSTRSFSGTVPEGLAASALFLESNLRAKLTGALEDAASLVLILNMDDVVEWTERLERDLVREGTLVRMGGSSGCMTVLSIELGGERLEEAVQRDAQGDRYEDGPGMDDQSSIL